MFIKRDTGTAISPGTIIAYFRDSKHFVLVVSRLLRSGYKENKMLKFS